MFGEEVGELKGGALWGWRRWWVDRRMGVCVEMGFGV